MIAALSFANDVSRLTALYNILSKQQIRDLETLLKSTDWRFDIIGNLPPELVLLVFEKLDHCNAFSSQRVSRRWLDLLSNDLTTGALIRSWRLLGDFELIIPEGALQRDICSLAAEHEQAFRTGNAFSRLCQNINLGEEDVLPVWAYCEGYIAWLAGALGSNKVALYHIKSGRRSFFVPTDREGINSFALSSELLVITTLGGKCYIWAYQSDRSPCTVRLPSIYIYATHVSANIVVLLIRPTIFVETTSDSQWLMMVVQCDTAAHSCGLANKKHETPIDAKTHVFILSLPRNIMMPQILLDKAMSYIILVGSTADPVPRIYLAQIDLRGEVQFEDKLPVGPQTEAFTFHVKESWLHEREVVFNIWLASSFDPRFFSEGEKHSLTEPMDYLHAQYYPDRRSFEVKTKKSYAYTFWHKYNSHHHIWKGIMYCDLLKQKHAKRKADMRIIDLEKGTCVYRDIGSIPEAEDNRTTALLGDEIFLVRGTSNGFDVWCFDKNVRMHGEDPIFRKKRERALQYRLKKQNEAVTCCDEALEPPEIAASRNFSED
ncbi:MAG: hypothetical protein Q9191_006433 [Dirinaria sp. TL-2023a]